MFLFNSFTLYSHFTRFLQVIEQWEEESVSSVKAQAAFSSRTTSTAREQLDFVLSTSRNAMDTSREWSGRFSTILDEELLWPLLPSATRTSTRLSRVPWLLAKECIPDSPFFAVKRVSAYCYVFIFTSHTSVFISPMFLATIHVGNVLPVGALPEGTSICNVEAKTGDRGRLAKASG